MFRFFLLFLSGLFLLNASKINGAGASFPAPLYYDWAYNYEKDTKNKVNYQSIGSGGGIKQVSARMVNFGASDKPLNNRLIKKYKLLQFPAVIGSIIVVHNINGIKDNALKLSNENVADIFAGRITKWNSKKIKKDNKDLDLPNEKIIVIRRSDGSGTTYNFTSYLSKSSKYWLHNIGVGKTVSWPVGLGAKGNEGIANLLKQIPYSISYIEQAYKTKEKLKGAVLKTKSGKWVEANEENFKAAVKYAKWSAKNHFYQLLTLSQGDNSYPIVAATFILLPKEKLSMNKKVIEFYKYSFLKGDKRARNLGYIPLPDKTKKIIEEYWKNNIK